MKSTYVGARPANVGDIQCSFAVASASTTEQYLNLNLTTLEIYKLIHTLL